MQGAVVGFTMSSILCGLAPNLPLLILFRVIQGATGGTMQPLSQAIMLEAFPPQDRGKDLLTGFILQYNHTPPPNWDGVIPLTSK